MGWRNHRGYVPEKKDQPQKPPRGYWTKQKSMDIDRYEMEVTDGGVYLKNIVSLILCYRKCRIRSVGRINLNGIYATC